MKYLFDVTFKATVVSVHVTIENTEVPLANQGDGSWVGSKEIDVKGPTTPLSMHFNAPAFTDWNLTVGANKKEVYDKSGTSDKNPFELRDTIILTGGAK